jgi:hypothetical protein
MLEQSKFECERWEPDIMKARGYIVRAERDRVTVEHRASLRLRTIIILSVGYICYCLVSRVRTILIDFYHSHDPVIGGFALLMMSIPFLFGVTWLFFTSGEVMSCDAHELRVARRRIWGRWHRRCFFSPQVLKFQRAVRGTSKSRNYPVLTFQYDGRSYDMLEYLSATDSDCVLTACKSMGVDAIITVDPGAAMLRDIDQRGWFVNPLRPDQNHEDLEGH